MTPNDPRRHKGFPDLPILLTLESWSGGPEISSFMPDVPQYSNKEIKVLWETELAIPVGYEVSIHLHKTDIEVLVDAKVILPSFEENKARSLAHRIEEFINGEMNIIKYGY